MCIANPLSDPRPCHGRGRPRAERRRRRRAAGRGPDQQAPHLGAADIRTHLCQGKRSPGRDRHHGQSKVCPPPPKTKATIS